MVNIEINKCKNEFSFSLQKSYFFLGEGEGRKFETQR